jgi:glycosyltransferase involved in cell wall biosynthesis
MLPCSRRVASLIFIITYFKKNSRGQLNMKKITILIPIFNEVNTLKIILQKVEEANFCGLEKEIILIDDFSTDGTREILKELEGKYKIFYHDKNMGKGAALRTGFEHVTGDITVIQDADLEYDPVDYEPLIQLILDGKADVAYGSRLSGGKPSRSFMFTHLLGNKVLTLMTNILYNTTLTDMETCYKAFKTEFIKGIEIKSNRFDFEPEITAKVLKRGARLYELPISYYGREYDEGKKITWKDGIHAILALIKFRFTD